MYQNVGHNPSLSDNDLRNAHRDILAGCKRRAKKALYRTDFNQLWKDGLITVCHKLNYEYDDA